MLKHYRDFNETGLKQEEILSVLHQRALGVRPLLQYNKQNIHFNRQDKKKNASKTHTAYQ